MSNGLFGGGMGTENDPYLVEDAFDLQAINDNRSAYYLQVKDIDASVIDNWQPIGDTSNGSPFLGYYDGQSYIISNLFIDNMTDYDLGLFGYCQSATLINIRVKKAFLKINLQSVGILAAQLSDCTVSNCHVTGKIEGQLNASIGGFAYSSRGSIIDKSSATNIDIRGSRVCGFIHSIMGSEIKNSYTTGVAKGVKGFGGNQLAPFTLMVEDSTISNCYSSIKMFDYADMSTLYPFYGEITNSYITSCYVDTTDMVDKWDGKKIYSQDRNHHVIGSDGKLYLCYVNQPYMGPDNPNLSAKPIEGETWSNYWKLADNTEIKSLSEMKQRDTFLDWDFETIWNIKENNSYPLFRENSKLMESISFIKIKEKEGI